LGGEAQQKPIMVNWPLPRTPAKVAHVAPDRHSGTQSLDVLSLKTPQMAGEIANFSQILDKLYFFQLLENLRRICPKTSPSGKRRLYRLLVAVEDMRHTLPQGIWVSCSFYCEWLSGSALC
jgi:hypothetical protein